MTYPLATMKQMKAAFISPDTRQFFRFGEIEYFIIEQSDGKSYADTICDKVAVKNEYMLDEAILEKFITSLRQYKLLKNQSSHRPFKPQDKRRLGSSLLYLRFSTYDPVRPLDYLVVKVRFIVIPYFLGVSAILILLSWLILITNADKIQLKQFKI